MSSNFPVTVILSIFFFRKNETFDWEQGLTYDVN